MVVVRIQLSDVAFETCIKSGEKIKSIAAIEDPKVVRKILERMGLAIRM